MIRIVTDSTAYISRDYAEKNDIEIIPLTVQFEGESKEEGYPGEFDIFFDKLKDSKDFPKTSQPPIGKFVEMFEKMIEDGDEVIAIMLSGNISGTYNTAKLAASMVDENKIHVIDSEVSCVALKFLIDKAVEDIRAGKKVEDIVKDIEEKKHKITINITVDTLDYLAKGGRLSNYKAMLGSMLNIKPIIAMEDGKLIQKSKVRGKHKAIEKMLDKIESEPKRIAVCHVMNLNEAEKMRDRLQIEYPNADIWIEEIGAVIGAHLGPGSIAIGSCCW